MGHGSFFVSLDDLVTLSWVHADIATPISGRQDLGAACLGFLTGQLARLERLV